ncbi:aminotransferase class I/II-fold pyridoxal phosphate-dependent enzyme [Actinoplanes aureus]|uniref:Aminotransferase class I/II-fold pyridoxal phosphate-dependent enzyme n=1 Tax=Actinoplanes aureus TaxID=2792083 RepID=A0A931FZW1_9ACTN|nr:aminotransferase class I/II-fold pyridoxal phosphate-dependent enzyme [Actinoplanes aureus]MBG0566098.1 aminotransferase class I/II-fold pyridoxal phosphate-dependent enzyme [Actinoplanes aureus]
MSAGHIERLLDRWLTGERVLITGTDAAGLTAALERSGRTVVVIPPEPGAPPADAAVCAGWPRPGDEPAHRRHLADLRRRLRPDGVLLLDQSAPTGSFDPLTGRCGATRFYHPTELSALVRAAGYRVEHLELTSSGTPPGVLIVARALPAPPDSLAVTAWGTAGEATRLDLRYADDETELLDPSPAKVWADLAAQADQVAGHYPVDDPFGGRRGAPVVSRFFGRPVAPAQLSFGAGVTSLLRDLAGLADGGPILAPAHTHPDLAAWAAFRGADVRITGEPATLAALTAEIRRVRPTLVSLDRPAFDAGILDLGDMVRLAGVVARADAVLVVDESAAAYLGPAGSLVTVAGEVDNLIVLRGFTKAYSWGGLRAGFAVCSPALAVRVRELITPMLIGELALHAALRVLSAGDPLAALRRRVRTVKPAFVNRLSAAGLTVQPGHPDIPWVVVADPDGSVERELAERGIRALLPVPAPVPAPPSMSTPLHLTVPISTRRIELFESLFDR